MARGGYQILDMKNIPLRIGQTVKVPGVYETLEGAYRKAVLLANVIIDGTECFDRFVVFGLSQSKFISQISIDGNINLLKMTIDVNDNVKLENN